MHMRVDCSGDFTVRMARAVKGTLVLCEVGGYLEEPHTTIDVLCPKLGFSKTVETGSELRTVILEVLDLLGSGDPEGE